VARAAKSTRTVEEPEMDWEVDAVAYLEARDQEAKYAKAKKAKYKAVVEALEELGEETEDGHRDLDLTHPVGDIVGLRWQRKVSETVDEEAAMKILEKKGLVDECVEMVPRLNQDAIMACFQRKQLTRKEVFTMFPEKVTYALVTRK